MQKNRLLFLLRGCYMKQSNFLAVLFYSQINTFFRLATLLFSMILIVGCATKRNPYSLEIKAAKIEQIYTEWRGTPYKFGGTNKRGVDCSGFVSVTFRDKFNINLPRSTVEQAKVGVKVNKSDLRSGDLVLFRLKNSANNLHVGIYHKNGHFIHASTSKGVILSSLNDKFWKSRYWQARRI